MNIHRTESGLDIATLSHPYPKNKELGLRTLEDTHRIVSRIGGKIEEFQTHSDPEASIDQTRIIASKFKEIVVIGGDGTVSRTYSELQKLKAEGLDIPYLNTYGGGHACDAAHMLHPVHRRMWPSFWNRGNPIEHAPLVIEADHKDLAKNDPRRSKLAVLYMSLGFTAAVTSVFNSEEFKEKTGGMGHWHSLISEGLEIPTKVGRTPRLLFEFSDRKAQMLGELSVPNGPRMAGGAAKFGGIELFEDSYGLFYTPEVNWRNIFSELYRARKGNFEKRSEPIEFSVQSLDESDIDLQIDGDSYKYPSGSKFKISLGNKVVSLISSREKLSVLDQTA